ncbi:MAG: acetate kinase [Endomicrobia bacterium]|nr:acetate kinase [Endomicrobiia bacterium]
MNILVLNCGSSSVKFCLFTDETRVLTGMVGRIGFHDAEVKYQNFIDKLSYENIEPVLDHKQALHIISKIIKEYNFNINIIGHRIVHGGEKFFEPVVITDNIKTDLKECITLAPLHNPYNLLGIDIAEVIFPETINIAVFDTAFHKTIPQEAALYPIPYEYYEKYKIRKYGFHGISHQFLVLKTGEILNKNYEMLKIITCHLGNGVSVTAIKNGKSIDTSMGFTPLGGLMMGTRSGDLDPGVITYIQQMENLTVRDIDFILNRKSGLLGVSSLSSDMRDIITQKEKNPRAMLAFKMYCYRVKKFISQYIGILNGVDCIVFSAGVGENSPLVREEVLKDMENLGIELDKKKNYQTIGINGIISSDRSLVKILVIKTDEEYMIAHICRNLIKKKV